MWGPSIGGLSPYGTGQYSGNIMQGGVALQPQDYLLDGVTPMPRCIVITGAATVAPDSTTGAAVYMVHNLALIGASASLSASTNCKGLLGFVNGRVALRGGAHLHMDKLGKAGNFGDLTPYDLLPTIYRRRVHKAKLSAYVIKGKGASGGASSSGAANNGTAAGAMQTGGGGTGSQYLGTVGRGGCGGPCCGGAGSGGANRATSVAAGDYGGPGGAGAAGGAPGACGGAGDPPGAPDIGSGGDAVYAGLGPGGGLIGLFAKNLTISAGCLVSADGAQGGSHSGVSSSGGSAGGGCVIIVTRPGGYSNAGTVRAAGGAPVGSDHPGAGGAGSVNTFELAA